MLEVERVDLDLGRHVVDGRTHRSFLGRDDARARGGADRNAGRRAAA